MAGYFARFYSEVFGAEVIDTHQALRPTACGPAVR